MNRESRITHFVRANFHNAAIMLMRGQELLREFRGKFRDSHLHRRIRSGRANTRWGRKGFGSEEKDKSGWGTKGSLRFSRNPHSEVLVVE